MPIIPDNNNDKPSIKMSVTRENGDTYFTFEVPKKLTDIFAEKSEEIKTSENWPNHQFYFMPEVLESSAYKDLLSEYNLFDNYGSKIINEENGKFNVAFLRTVGGKGKIQLNQDLPFAKVADQVRNITRFLKAYYEEFLTDYKVSGSVTIEI